MERQQDIGTVVNHHVPGNRMSLLDINQLKFATEMEAQLTKTLKIFAEEVEEPLQVTCVLINSHGLKEVFYTDL
jgi:hypothetical protein